MTWAERYVDRDGGLWALIHTPRADDRCIYGEPWLSEHMHLIDPAPPSDLSTLFEKASVTI